MNKKRVTEEKKTAAEEKSIFGVIMHSFFVIPFFVAVFCILLFTAVHMLTSESQDSYDYLDQVKTGGLTKRWQAAFELSKLLANEKHIPPEERFVREMVSAFRHARTDDDRVRQYLALAMGRTGNPAFVGPLLEDLAEEKEQNISAILYALGLIGDTRSTPVLVKYLNHTEPRIRSIAAVALGTIGDPAAIKSLKISLTDTEPNVQWGSALSLARLGDPAGKGVVLNLLTRDYYQQFPEVDAQEKDQLILEAVRAAAGLNDADLNHRLKIIAESDNSMIVRSAALKIVNR